MEVKYNTLISLRPSMKCHHSKRKIKLVVAVSLVLLSLLSYCKCQKEVCGTKADEAIDVMWMIHTNNDIESSDFLVLKQFLSDMMLWFRISFSSTNGTRHGCLIYSDTVQEVSNYEISVEKAQKNFIGLKCENTTKKWYDKASDYLVKSSVSSDRETAPNVAIVVTTGEPSPTANTTSDVTQLTKAGWKIIFLVIGSKVNHKISSEPQLDDKNYYIVGSFGELKSLEFQEFFAEAVCDHYIEETNVWLRRNSDLEETKVRLRRNSGIVQGYANVAEKKPARQSSTVTSYNASKAVDGTAAHNLSSFCSKTMESANKNWWEVDLINNFDIEYVGLLNIQDKVTSMTQKLFEIIGHNGYHGLVQKDPELCASREEVALGISELFQCEKIMEQKRYVRIEQIRAYPNNDMAFCEVEVFTAWPPGYYNVALNKTASSRSAKTGSSELTVNGNIKDGGSCFLTEGHKLVKEWWEVDLQEAYDILGISIFVGSERYLNLKHLDIIAYKELIGVHRSESQICGSIIRDTFFSLRHFECEMSEKRFVRMEHNEVFRWNYLELCEVEVWAECAEGYYGRDCKGVCPECSEGGVCDRITGHCNDTAVIEEDHPEEQISSSSNSGAIAGAVVGVLLIAAAGAAVGGLFYYRKKNNVPNEENVNNNPEVEVDDEPRGSTDEPPISFKWLWEKKRNSSRRSKT